MTRYHYVLTVQHPGRDFRLGTHHGIYEGRDDGTEEQRYDDIYRTVQELEGTTRPLATLFYRCVPDAPSPGPQLVDHLAGGRGFQSPPAPECPPWAREQLDKLDQDDAASGKLEP